MATKWHWDYYDEAVWIIQRVREGGHIADNRVMLTRQQIDKLAADIQVKDEGTLP